jgi:alkylation response protein AidB-like acyl-CoA dehydrogenase
MLRSGAMTFEEHPILVAAREAGPALRAGAAENDGLRRLSDEVAATLKATGAHRMLVPRTYGGGEVPAAAFLRVVEALAEADGSAGWVANIWATSASMAWFMPAEAAESVFSDPGAAHAGAFAPTGNGETLEGGWRVRGRWSWGSGIHHARWISGGAMCEDGMHLMWFPAEEVTIHDTWFAGGLRGTGSSDFEVAGAFVPAGREVPVGRIGPQVAGPLGVFPNFCLLAAGVAACCLGIARRAVDEALALATEKRPAMSNRVLAEHVPAQLSLGEAEASLASGRAFLFEEVARAWDAATRGERIATEQKARVRLAAAHAAAAAARAVDLAYAAGGGSSVFESSPLQRCFRDVHTATAHAMLGDRFISAWSRVRMGLEPGVAFL